ncbi:MAG: ribokinase [Peptostreptococcaceae bacterium]|jgi:ribokinase|nr:ribokinase [Peptostreptococcaceae bacterium]
MKKILVLGSLNMDLVTNVEKTPKVGETVLGSDFNEIPGGKGANQAVAIGKLNGDVCMLGRIGNDDFGKSLIKNLKQNNVNVDFVKSIQSAKTGIALIMVNSNGDNSIVVIPGANFEFKENELKKDIFNDVDYLLAQLETPLKTIEKAFILAKEKNVFTILNPAPARVLSDELIKHTDLLIPNETEFESLSGYDASNEANIIKGSNVLFEKGVKAILITLGKNGSFYIDSNNFSLKQKGYIVDVVDTTAAGDSFIGGFLTSISKGEDIKTSMEFATKVSALTVTKYGAQSSLPSILEVDNFK